ncbi:MAG: ParA family protein [Acidimicrobiales bacterium]|nr:ParA family protein [Acidimicrobiales bacterium]
MGRVTALANQKGGVAKTTSTLSLGVGLAELGRRVLLIDLDPQASLTYSVGLDPDRLDVSLHDVFVRRTPAEKVIQHVRHLDIIPSTIDLAGSEVHLLTRTGREHALKRALTGIRENYDNILLDLPPSLGVLTINGLTAADDLLIPVACETLSHRGVGQLLETVDDVRAFANPHLIVRGIIVTLFDDRTRHAREIYEDLPTRYGLHVLSPPVRKSIRFAEAPSLGQSVLDHSPTSAGAEAYRQIARQIAAFDSDIEIEGNNG